MRSWSVFAGRFRGVEVRVHLTFFFLLTFVLLVKASERGALAIVHGTELTALTLAAVLIHEAGHIVAAQRAGVSLQAVILLPTGGVSLADPASALENKLEVARETRIAVAGPLASGLAAFITGIAAASLFSANYLWTAPLVSIDALGRSFFWLNLFLFVANLLPAYPLDAGRILRAKLAETRDLRRATRQAVNLGHLCAAGFMLAGVLWSQWLMLAGLSLFFAALMEERTAMFHSVAEAVHMEDIMLTQFSTLSPADTLEDALNQAVHSLQDDFPVVSGGDLVGVINRQVIVDSLRREGNGYVQAAMNRAFEVAGRRESLASAFRKLTTRGLTLIPIVDQEQLVGIVTLQNVMHSMGLLAESRRLKKQLEESP
ncbi:MAG TPA: site-2 protease family protein [Terriglobales bacterium]|jgi:Zn-dependent protease/predicted transcriptional regulator|nr:site-2 protease family protein [Terriglobales bacterium]